jgi:hypothetical protein
MTRTTRKEKQMDLKQLLNDAITQTDATRAELAKIPYDFEAWQQITAAEKTGTILEAAKRLHEATDSLRSISAALEWIASQPNAFARQPKGAKP